MTTCDSGSCSVNIVSNKPARPTFMVQYRRGLMFPAGSTAYDANDYWYTPTSEDRAPGCGVNNWRRLDMRSIWLKLQRLSECQADFIFPPIMPAVSASVCDEAPMAQIWALGSVGTKDGKLYTPKRNGVMGGSTLSADDWCGGYTSAEVIAHVLKLMCAGNGGNIG